MVKNRINTNSNSDTETSILEAARRVFLHKGMDGARMQDIADEAGINKALLHYYFKSKQLLFDRVFREAASRLFAEMTIIMREELPLFEKIRLFTDRYVTIVMETPYLPMFVLSEVHRDPALFMEKVFHNQLPPLHRLAADIDAEVRAGTIHPISPAQLIMNLISLTVFPFIGKPMFSHLMQIDEVQFRFMMEQRKKQVADFIIQAIRK